MITDTDPDPGAWPAVVREPRPWTTNADVRSATGARPGRADRLLTEITVEIPQPIADRSATLAPSTGALCDTAGQRIAALDADAGRHLSALAAFLTRTESTASSRIERIDADLDDLARASLGERASAGARSMLAATHALQSLTASCDDGAPLTQDAILAAHADLMGEDLFERRSAGAYRTQQNWIGGSDFSPRHATHVPPPPETVAPLMVDLVSFAARDDLPVVAHAALVHGQFEAIHPFNDGNGRIGRGLISAMLRRRRTTRRVVVPIAGVMLADVDAYFDRLRAYRTGDADALVAYVADAAIRAAEAAEVSAVRLAELPARWDAAVTARRGSAARALVSHLLDHPILDIATAETLTGVSRMRTYGAVDTLTDAGVLHEITGQGRNRVWVATDVMDELDALEERIGARMRPSRHWYR